ncbi:MAG: hypothetical protein HYY17_10095 [Planctomycetes bacterium]|nr:hypothetical protein [Planctomycetota bacterium]
MPRLARTDRESLAPPAVRLVVGSIFIARGGRKLFGAPPGSCRSGPEVKNRDINQAFPIPNPTERPGGLHTLPAPGNSRGYFLP